MSARDFSDSIKLAVIKESLEKNNGNILCEKIKQRRKYKFTIAFCNLMKHITKVNEIQGNRGVVVTGGFGFDTNGNPISKRLS